jgi:hypothetical protein
LVVVTVPLVLRLVTSAYLATFLRNAYLYNIFTLPRLR